MERLTAIVVLALAFAPGCFEPQLRDGQLSCEDSQFCPSGFFCLDGLCRNQAPGDGKGDEPADQPDGSVPDPDGGTPAAGPMIYELSIATWTATAADVFFAGSGLDIATIETAWAHCDDGISLRCFADDDRVACKDGASWGSSPWSEIDGALAGFNPTFSSAYRFGGDWAFDTHAGDNWRGYEGPALRVTGGAVQSDLNLVLVSGQGGVEDLDKIYGNDPNAPSSFDDVVADFIDVSASGDPWSFLTATGYLYTVRQDTTTTLGRQDPSLVLPGAPLAQDVKAALHCDGKLLYFALK